MKAELLPRLEAARLRVIEEAGVDPRLDLYVCELIPAVSDASANGGSAAPAAN